MHKIEIADSGSLSGVDHGIRNAARIDIIKPFIEGWECPVFIETGTYKGNMVNAVLDVFTWIISIEYGKILAEEARKRLSGQHHVEIIHGDSGEKLPKLFDRLRRDGITGEILFFLDAHYSDPSTAKGPLMTPIEEELRAIAQVRLDPVVILVDDVASFGGQEWPTQDWVYEFCRDNFTGFKLDIFKDIFRIYKEE